MFLSSFSNKQHDRVGGTDEDSEKNYTVRQKMKRMMKRYGAVGFGVYASVYVSFWSGEFEAVDGSCVGVFSLGILFDVG